MITVFDNKYSYYYPTSYWTYDCVYVVHSKDADFKAVFLFLNADSEVLCDFNRPITNGLITVNKVKLTKHCLRELLHTNVRWRSFLLRYLRLALKGGILRC